MQNPVTQCEAGPDTAHAPYQAQLDAGDFSAAIPLLRAAVAAEDSQAMAILGGLLAAGRGVPKDSDEACLWFRQAAVRGSVFGMASLGVCLAAGCGTPVDRRQSAYWLYQAGMRGHGGSVDVLGALAYRHHDIVGEYFSEDELIRLVMSRKAEKHLARRRSPRTK